MNAIEVQKEWHKRMIDFLNGKTKREPVLEVLDGNEWKACDFNALVQRAMSCRVRPEVITICNIEIPAPCDVMPSEGDMVYILSFDSRDVTEVNFDSDVNYHVMAFKRGMMYLYEFDANAALAQWAELMKPLGSK